MPSMPDLSLYKFRPQGSNKRYQLRRRRLYNTSQCEYHWYPRNPPRRIESLNRATMGRIFGRLHYLSSHAPAAVANQWRNADLQFRLKHIPYRNNSMRYLRLFTTDSWL